MISEWVRERSRGLVGQIARLISRTGVRPIALTVAGFVLNIGVAYLLAVNPGRLAGLLVLVFSPLDALDGALARFTDQVTLFGAFLDSTLDRFSESVLYFGLLFYYAQQGALQQVLLTYVTIVGSLLVSYTRARAEGLGIECKVGLFARPERVVVLGAGLLLQQMSVALWVLAVGSTLTAVYRMWHVWRASRF